GQHLLDAGDGRQRLGGQAALVADDADDGAGLAAAEGRLETPPPDALQDGGGLLIGRIGGEGRKSSVGSGGKGACGGGGGGVEGGWCREGRGGWGGGVRRGLREYAAPGAILGSPRKAGFLSVLNPGRVE